jgi:hypothetical protein
MIVTFGPNETPPPGRRGVRREPIRALPVPFWAYGFFPPPLTSALVKVLAVPWGRSCLSIPRLMQADVGALQKHRGNTPQNTWPCSRLLEHATCMITVRQSSNRNAVLRSPFGNSAFQ